MTIRKWARQHEKSLQRAATWAGLSVALVVLFFMLTLANFNGHYSALRRLPLGKAWIYLAAHQRSATTFHRMESFGPLVCIVTLTLAVRELMHPSSENGAYPIGFWGRMVLLVASLSGLSYCTAAMVTAVGNFPSGQNLLTGFPHQTFYRLFVRNGQVNPWYVVCVTGWILFWLVAVALTLAFATKDIRRHLRERNSSGRAENGGEGL